MTYEGRTIGYEIQTDTTCKHHNALTRPTRRMRRWAPRPTPRAAQQSKYESWRQLDTINIWSRTEIRMISGSNTLSLRTTTESKTYHPCMEPNTIKIWISRTLRTTIGSNTYTPLPRAENQDDACFRPNPKYSVYIMINRPMARSIFCSHPSSILDLVYYIYWEYKKNALKK